MLSASEILKTLDVNFMSACDLLEQELKGRKLDIVTYKGLSPYIGKHILNEVVYV